MCAPPPLDAVGCESNKRCRRRRGWTQTAARV